MACTKMKKWWFSQKKWRFSGSLVRKSWEELGRVRLERVRKRQGEKWGFSQHNGGLVLENQNVFFNTALSIFQLLDVNGIKLN